MKHHTFYTVALAVAMLAPALLAQQKRPIERADQLPVHSYPVRTTAIALLQDETQFAALAQQLQTDLRADLAAYDIQDRATLKSYYRTLSNLALLRGDYKAAVAHQDSIRAVEDKPGLRLVTGIVERAMAAAARGPGQPLDTAAFRNAFRREIAALPYSDVQVPLAEMKSRRETFGAMDVPRFVNNQIEPSARSGSLPLQQAQGLIVMRVVIDRLEPVRGVLISELAGIMASHKAAKTDIWAARDVSLEGRTDLTPVTIAIWDGGVDVDVFPGQLFTNSGEIADNGKDDDGNGYIDDVHGIAYDIDRGRTTGMLQPVSLTPAGLVEMRELQKLQMDIEAGLNAPEADALRRRAASVSPDSARAYARKFREYQLYFHGTHVAGIAVRGNPAARILVARRSRGMGGPDQFQVTPQPPTMARARAFAQEFRESIEYFRQHGVRVVNMSWGIHPAVYETNLAANNIGTPEERRRLARQMFDVVKTGLHDAMAAAPDMLFVGSAGNQDADVSFNETLPASFDLPNLVTAGAVDAAGDETSFTSYGKVDVYANGYHVLSKVPGGFTLPANGTSMAAPQVVNLAAKLLAVKPQLTVAELRRTIVESADEKPVGQNKRIKLFNPKAALERISDPHSTSTVRDQPNRSAQPLAIENVAVIAMDSAPEVSRVRREMTVVVEGGRVRAVARASEVKIPAGAMRIDGTGRYLIPGLRDMHVHFDGANSAVGQRRREVALRSMLAAGVIGARIMSGSPAILDLRDRIKRGALAGPDLYVAGPIIDGVPPAGFAEVMDTAGKVIVHDSADAVRVVREQAAAGYDFIKVYNNIPANAYPAIVAEAKRLGLPVAGHVPFATGLDGALAAGQVSIEHLRGYVFKLVPSDAPQQPGRDLRSQTLAWAYADVGKIEALAKRTRDAGVWNVPTLVTQFLFQPDADLEAYLRSERTTVEQAHRFIALLRAMPWMSNFSNADLAAAKTGFAAQDSLVRALVGVGAGVMAGTDTPPPGLALHRELEMLVAAGLTPYQALEAAIRNPARFLGRKDGSGTVKPGSPADLVLLDANPLDDIANTRKIRAVVLHGQYLDRAALDSLLAEAEPANAQRHPKHATSRAGGEACDNNCHSWLTRNFHFAEPAGQRPLRRPMIVRIPRAIPRHMRCPSLSKNRRHYEARRVFRCGTGRGLARAGLAGAAEATN